MSLTPLQHKRRYDREVVVFRQVVRPLFCFKRETNSIHFSLHNYRVTHPFLMKTNVHLTFFLAHPLRSSTGGEKVPGLLGPNNHWPFNAFLSTRESKRLKKVKLFILEFHSVGGPVTMSLSLTPK